MTLTESGGVYLENVRNALHELDRARELATRSHAGPTGTLRVTASVAFGTMCLAPLLRPFRDIYPGLEVELLLNDANFDLVADRIDLAVRLRPSVQADVIVTKLMDTRYLVCAAPDYLARHERPVLPADIGRHDCVLFALPNYRARWVFRDATGSIEEVKVRGGVAISSALALRAATLEGLGPALLPHWLVAEDLARGTLIDVFPAHRVTATDFSTAAWLLYPSRDFLPAKVRIMVDFLKCAIAG